MRSLGGSSTYVRWGRTTCPQAGNGTELVYEGYAGGSHYTHSGAAVDYLCLPKNPDWDHFEPAAQSGGLVYGAEYEYSQRASSAKFFPSQTSSLVDNDVPCAVCRSTRSSVLMVPAKNQCHPGWTHEYHGYLSAGYHKHAAASEYVCVDREAEWLNGGKTTNHNGKMFYFVEGRCGSLQCPPYENGKELTCVVCTK